MFLRVVMLLALSLSSIIVHADGTRFLILPLSNFATVGTGWYYDPATGYDNGADHHGIDFPAPLVTKVRAAAAGWAIAACQPGKYGNFVLVAHNNGYSSVYAHLGYRDVAGQRHTGVLLSQNATMPVEGPDGPCPPDVHDVGPRHSISGNNSIAYGGHTYLRQWVEQGEIIGEVGLTGNTDAPHLHFEVAENTRGSYALHISGKLDPYDIERIAFFYPPPDGKCSNVGSQAAYLWTIFCPVADTAPGTWTQKFPSTSPSPRTFHAMAYDVARAQMVLFGGQDNSGYRNDTWVWNGTNWTQRSPVNSPIARAGHAMAYDAARGQVVLFGGSGSGTGGLTDTWVWDGTNWTQKSPANSPIARTNHAMAYDAALGQVVLFGGFHIIPGSGSNGSNDTWIWDGTNWTQRSPVNSPIARAGHAMAYDAARGQVVLFGGGGGVFLNDTWVWNGTNWTQESPANSPIGRQYPAMAYDAGRGETVLFGGSYSGGYLNDTWIWDGTNWTQKSPANSPTLRYGHAMAYDAARGQVILFGGYDANFRNDTWVSGP